MGHCEIQEAELGGPLLMFLCITSRITHICGIQSWLGTQLGTLDTGTGWWTLDTEGEQQALAGIPTRHP